MLKYGASDMSEDVLSKHWGHLLHIDPVSGHVRFYRDSVSIQKNMYGQTQTIPPV
jgi:hypothetical protein